MTTPLERLVQLMGMTASQFDGEAVNALRLANQVLKQNDLSWRDVILSQQSDMQRLQERCAYLEAENQRVWSAYGRAREQYNDLKEEMDAPPPPANHREEARRVFNLWREGKIHLDEWEQEFIRTVARWSGPLTPKQRPIWDRILGKAKRATR